MASEENFDYIVVGAGSAGCVVARRLLDRLDCRVLLLEAGGSDDRASVHATDLGSMTSMWGPEDVSWPYRTAPQPGLDGRRIDLTQGKIIGGGSSINAMMYVRGNRHDFDHWAELGNPGWSYQDVLPYFRRAERYAGKPSQYRGTDGPLSVIDYENPSAVSQAFVAGAAELGHDVEHDYNGERQEGGGFFYQSTRTPDNQRASTAAGYLDPVLDDPRLTVLTGALVSRVLVADGRATGVEFRQDGQTRTARADAEVILTAGALASPKLLLLSGIGPEEELRRHGVPLVHELAGVGRNLQDHLLFGVGYESLQDLPFPQLLAEAGLFARSREREGITGGGPDLQFFFGPVQFIADQYKTEGPGFTFAPILAQPRSRGFVHLSSADPAALPVVDPHYLTAEADVQVLVRGLALSREIVHTSAFDPFRGRELAPGPEAVDPAELAGYVRQNASTVWHPVGTCRMGHGLDAVVDAALRVHGIERLRVADASIMPTITTGNTNAATIMIAEKAADLITDAAR
ncbi:GMC family oxidoreductase [Kitasatospora azatica]|uniref:GMC family oxidoreductase n=1 Tax=Kitasatospora azatica TaxID=58347 RepID=UPI00055F1ABA|nr:GMC family oxidoreductase N-terminal domain-containing protein [Kitasatospora azatica]